MQQPAPQGGFIGGVPVQGGEPQTIVFQGNPQQQQYPMIFQENPQPQQQHPMMFQENPQQQQQHHMVFQGIPQQQQQPQVIFINAGTEAQPRTEFPNYKIRATKVMGIIQIILGTFCIAMNIGLAAANYNNQWMIGAGWWASPVFIIAGSFGIASAFQPNKCLIVTTMVMSIIAITCVIGVVTQAILQLATDCSGCWYDDDRAEAASDVMSSLLLVFGLAEFAVGLAQSIFCCQVICCGSKAVANGPSPNPMVYYNSGFVSGPSQQNIPPSDHEQKDASL